MFNKAMLLCGGPSKTKRTLIARFTNNTEADFLGIQPSVRFLSFTGTGSYEENERFPPFVVAPATDNFLRGETIELIVDYSEIPDSALEWTGIYIGLYPSQPRDSSGKVYPSMGYVLTVFSRGGENGEDAYEMDVFGEKWGRHDRSTYIAFAKIGTVPDIVEFTCYEMEWD